VAYTWQACAAGTCRTAADTTATPFAARRYVVGHADTGRLLKLTETASEVVETDPGTFAFSVVHASRSVLLRAPVEPYPAGRAPTTGFVNGTPERRTASAEEYFEVGPPHYNAADGTPVVSYRVDGHRWRPLPGSRLAFTGKLRPGVHRVVVRTADAAGASLRSFRWRVVRLPAPVACVARHGRACWYPPHRDRRGRPMRWDWQIGRVTPLERTGAHAVDAYDIDGFLTTPAELRALHTAWPASTLPHPKAICYLDLAWEDYRPDGSPASRGGRFPVAALGKVYFGYPQERWLDFRRLDSLKPMLRARIRMCAAKGFDAVELDDIDSFDPPSTTGFHLTPGDAQNFLSYAMNAIHRSGMTVLWKNSGLLSWWGRRYADGAVVEECYLYRQCFSAQLAGSRQYGFTCTAVTGPTPCGWDDFTTDTTRHQPTGKWVGEVEYAEDGYVCAPGGSCTGPRRFSSYCAAIEGPSSGFAAMRLDVDLDGRLFQPCPAGR
jgi:glycosyl hydrolase family 114